MGLYNTYNGIQLKVNRYMDYYSLGDEVDIPDGVYLGWNGVVIVKDSILIATYMDLHDEWGRLLDIEKILMEGERMDSESLVCNCKCKGLAVFSSGKCMEGCHE